MRIKLWLDDFRPAPAGWTHVYTARQAIALLATGEVREISLDHDLGEPGDIGYEIDSGTGYDVATWLEANPEFLPARFSVHSANPVGARKMLVALQNASVAKQKMEQE